MNNLTNVTVISHPLIQQSLTMLRDETTDLPTFRRLLRQITQLMTYELTRDYPTETVEVTSPLGRCAGSRLAVELTLVPVLRAGLGMVDGVLDLVPNARVGHLGMYRDENSLKPVPYYQNLPPNLREMEVIVIDPMLATGGSLSAAIEFVRAAGAERIKTLCLVASPEGIACLQRAQPAVPIYTAAIDERLDDRGYIVPGLGDAGDRLFGTA